jgi:hypothetical protein
MTLTEIKDQTIGLIEVKQRNGDYLSTTVVKFKDKLITGTDLKSGFLRNEWEVDLNNYYSLDEALEDLYTQVADSARAQIGKRKFL